MRSNIPPSHDELLIFVYHPFPRLVAQLIGPRTHEHYGDGPSLEDMDLVAGPDRRQYASFSWEDLQIIAPWLDNSGAITKVMFGVGLGN